MKGAYHLQAAERKGVIGKVNLKWQFKDENDWLVGTVGMVVQGKEQV